MNISDPIADMLTRVRNASRARHTEVIVPASRTKREIARILKDEGFIADVAEEQEGPVPVLRLTLKYVDGKVPVVSGLKRISKPGLRVYARKTDIPRVLGGLGIVIVSTSAGIMTGQQAYKAQLGGEVLAYVWVAMSRIGRLPIAVPATVDVTIDGRTLTVKGPKGSLTRALHPDMIVSREDSQLVVTRPTEQKVHRQLHGLTRTLVNNMVVGVTDGYRKGLEITGVGYRAALNGRKLQLNLGYSHPIEIDPPDGISFEVETPTRLAVIGIDKELVGQMAAQVRSTRKPEPYKGKGVRYSGEVIRRKAGKAGKIGGKK